MNTDFLILKLPFFKPKYKKGVKYGYSNPKEKKNTKAVLSEASRGYCMYCYSRVLVDRKQYGHLEHAIERKNSDKLLECVPNLGLSCSTCNDAFKKIGEKKRKLREEDIIIFHQKTSCEVSRRKQCTVPCKALKMLQEAYRKNENAEIIFQPMGMRGWESGEPMGIQYDVLRSRFQAAVNFYTYTEAEQKFIEKHIDRFHLNDPEYQTGQLFDFIRIVIDQDGKLPNYEYNHLVVELFADYLKDRTREEILNICEKLYLPMFYIA